MSNMDDDAIDYKNITREEIEKLTGLEREKAQMISGIHLSHKRTLKAAADSPKVEEYIILNCYKVLWLNFYASLGMKQSPSSIYRLPFLSGRLCHC